MLPKHIMLLTVAAASLSLRDSQVLSQNGEETTTTSIHNLTYILISFNEANCISDVQEEGCKCSTIQTKEEMKGLTCLLFFQACCLAKSEQAFIYLLTLGFM